LEHRLRAGFQQSLKNAAKGKARADACTITGLSREEVDALGEFQQSKHIFKKAANRRNDDGEMVGRASRILGS
jgi:hypothetical protein